MSNILLVEDDKALAEVIQEYLIGEGFFVELVSDGIEACSRIIQDEPDLVILDVMLPGKDGLTVCREVRPSYSGYIIMFTAREDEIDQIVGLELGADDYLIKPVKPRLLLAKVKAFLRRSDAENNETQLTQTLEFNKLVINLEKREVILDGELTMLTSAEYDLLIVLAKRAGSILSRDEITKKISGGEYDGLERTIDNKISQLRRKLGDDASVCIKTVRSKGYLFVPSAWA